MTLKPLDDVWQEKTEAYMKKIQAFVPSIVKDVWLMEPIQVTLRAMKTGLDMVSIKQCFIFISEGMAYRSKHQL